MFGPMRTFCLLLAAGWLIYACEGKPSGPEQGKQADAAASSSVAPTTSQPAPPELPAPRAAQPSPARSKLKAPARGCVMGPDLAVRDDAAQAWAIASGTDERVLVLRADRRTLELWQLDATPVQLKSVKLEQPVAKLAVSRGSKSALGWVDDKGDVWLAREPLKQPVRVAQGADRRFAPALAEADGQLLLTFTRTVDEAMHTFLVRDGKLSDLTPAGHGASAASFVLGVTPPVLVMLDARAGISPLLEVPFDAQGIPKPAIVRTPISQPYAPPLLAAVQLPGGELEVAFSAIGKLAATAIGRVPLRRAVGPVALHPSRGYGELRFDVALSGKAALFALEVPVSEAPKAARVIELKWLDAQGEGETLVIGAQGASGPSIVANRIAGEVQITYVARGTAHAARLLCAQ